MKRKILFLAVICLVSGFMVNVKLEQKKSFVSYFTLANIEALAITEDEFAEVGCECAEPDEKCSGSDGHTYTAARNRN